MAHSTLPRRSQFLPLLALATLLVGEAQAQLVYIPDATLRTKMNGVVPGCVDGTGYLDTQYPGVQGLATWNLAVDWDPSDLTGIEHFTGLTNLGISYYGVPTNSTLSAFPLNLSSLVIAGFPGVALPAFPNGLTSLSVDTAPMLTTMGSVPNGITQLSLNALSMLSAPINIPTASENISLTGCPEVTSITGFPSTLRELRISGPLVDSLPPLPTTMDWLDISFLPQLVHIANLPDTMNGTCSLYELPMLGSLPDFPVVATDNSIDLFNLPLIDSLPALPMSVLQLSFNGMPLVTELPPLPQDLVQMQLTDLPALHCLPSLPAGLMSIYLDATVGVTCVPYLTAGMAQNPQFYPPVCNFFSGNCPFQFASIGGTFYHDVNTNGARDVGEPGLTYAHASITPGNTLVGAGPNGAYSMALDPGTYSIQPVLHGPYVLSASPLVHTATLTSTADVDSLNDFGLVLQPNVQDLRVATTLFPARPGFDNEVWISYSNVGTIPMNGSVSLTFDSDQSWVGAVPPPDQLTGNTATWNFVGLGLAQSGLAKVTLHTDAAVPLWTPLEHTAMIGPLATDMTPADNTFIDHSEVVGSFDPNDKRVVPGELTSAEVLAGDLLSYTIRFQNTGTYLAERVVITDSLSPDLQVGTFQLIASSHPCSWAIGDGVLRFTFDGIMLPDSNSNEPGSHGFVTFRMRPVGSLISGDQIGNIANIYFDFNAPVITNEALFTVNDANVIEEVTSTNLRLWPNPVRDMLMLSFVDAPQDRVIEVIDLTGRSVLRTQVTGDRLVLPVAHFAPGLYTVRYGSEALRFVKD